MKARTPRLISSESARPKRTFLLLSPNRDGAIDKYRTTIAELMAMEARNGQMAFGWRYEEDGEGGVYPTTEEWTETHRSQDYRCGNPCRACKAAGHDPDTGKSIARKAAP